MTWMNYSLAVLDRFKDSTQLMFLTVGCVVAVAIMYSVRRTDRGATRRQQIQRMHEQEMERIKMTKQIPAPYRNSTIDADRHHGE